MWVTRYKSKLVTWYMSELVTCVCEKGEEHGEIFAGRAEKMEK